MSCPGSLDRTPRNSLLFAVWYCSVRQLRRPLVWLYQPPSRAASNRSSRPISSPMPVSRDSTAPSWRRSWLDQMDGFFIQALVRATSCPQHAKSSSTWPSSDAWSGRHHKTRRKTAASCTRGFKTSSGAPTESIFHRMSEKLSGFARRELQQLVDYYDIHVDTAPDPWIAPEQRVWNVGHQHTPWILPGDPAQQKQSEDVIKRLEALLANENAPHAELCALYRSLPSPGVAYLQLATVRELLHQLAIVEDRNPVTTHRFLAVLDDMKAAEMPIIRSEWTSAIQFAGRFMRRVSADEVESALVLWKEMEEHAGVRGSDVTFNVLFNIAVRAGKYALAESLLAEMKRRRLPLQRHLRTSLIYYHGVCQDGAAVRRAYRDLVAAGEIVDTVVLNAVVAALLRAGEPRAADHVFERMKRLHRRRQTSLHAMAAIRAPTSWRETRKLGLRLAYDAHRFRASADAFAHGDLRALQDRAPIAPDARTYALLVRHHAIVDGNIDRVDELLADLAAVAARELHSGDARSGRALAAAARSGSMALLLLQGFARFGGAVYSSWRLDRLERVWADFLRQVDAEAEAHDESGAAPPPSAGPPAAAVPRPPASKPAAFLSPTAAIAALHAFRKCAGKRRTARVWDDDISPRARLFAPDGRDHCLRVLTRIVPEWRDPAWRAAAAAAAAGDRRRPRRDDAGGTDAGGGDAKGRHADAGRSGSTGAARGGAG